VIAAPPVLAAPVSAENETVAVVGLPLVIADAGGVAVTPVGALGTVEGMTTELGAEVVLKDAPLLVVVTVTVNW
jgi:hypothetical protein